jgi:hypothetical protein
LAEEAPALSPALTPTSAFWLNQVERFFGLMTEERIRRGAFTSVADLETAIFDYLEHHNASPKPFIWKASANYIVKKVAHAGCNCQHYAGVISIHV